MPFPNIQASSPYTLLIWAALAPALVLFFYVYRKDTVEHEPVGLLIRLVIGGVIAAPVAGAVEVFGQGILDSMPISSNSHLYQALLAFAVVALAEEGVKFFFLFVNTWKNDEFNFTFDGIVYGTTVSLGFATLENILYVIQGGMSTAIARAILSVPGHASWGVFMGSFYGQAKVNASRGDKVGTARCLALSLIVPIFLHGLYDTLAFIGTDFLTLVLFGVCIATDIYVIVLLRRAQKNDAPIGSLVAAGSAAQQSAVQQVQGVQQQIPGQGYQQAPVQGMQYQAPVQTAPVPQSGWVQMPGGSVPQQLPTQNVPQQLPTQNVPQQLPTQSVQYQMPDQRVVQQLPTQNVAIHAPEATVSQFPQQTAPAGPVSTGIPQTPTSERADAAQVAARFAPRSSSQAIGAETTPAAQAKAREAAGVRKCPVCGTMNPVEYHHCFQCGTKLLL